MATYNLQLGDDNFIGTADANVFYVASNISWLSETDRIDGLGGTDILQFASTSLSLGYQKLTDLTSVEVLDMTAATSGASVSLDGHAVSQAENATLTLLFGGNVLRPRRQRRARRRLGLQRRELRERGRCRHRRPLPRLPEHRRRVRRHLQFHPEPDGLGVQRHAAPRRRGERPRRRRQTDTMAGGTGDDKYIVDRTTDLVVEAVNGGKDTIESTVTYSLAGLKVEYLVLKGEAAINATGNAYNNTIVGNLANNFINGGAGADRMLGGKGNDYYNVDNIGGQVVEKAGQGYDTVNSTVDFSLAGTAVEKLTLSSSGNIKGTGNTGANEIIGNSRKNVIDGDLGADILAGGNDHFYFKSALGSGNVDRSPTSRSGLTRSPCRRRFSRASAAMSARCLQRLSSRERPPRTVRPHPLQRSDRLAVLRSRRDQLVEPDRIRQVHGRPEPDGERIPDHRLTRTCRGAKASRHRSDMARLCRPTGAKPSDFGC